MESVSELVFGPFRLRTRYPFSSEDFIQLRTLIGRRDIASAPRGVGRSGGTFGTLPQVGEVVVKHYLRGGLLSHIVRRRYLGIGPYRPFEEYNCLEEVRALGVHAPEPVVAVIKGEWLYQGWLVTRAIPGARTLAEVAPHDEDLARTVMDDVVRQVRLLVSHGIAHIDLHPGNVLIDSAGKVYLIDFDKAHHTTEAPSALRERYLLRWRRAVLKHELPDMLSEMISVGLLRTATP